MGRVQSAQCIYMGVNVVQILPNIVSLIYCTNTSFVHLHGNKKFDFSPNAGKHLRCVYAAGKAAACQQWKLQKNLALLVSQTVYSKWVSIPGKAMSLN